MSITDKAQYYLLKELYDEVYRPGRPYEEVSAAVSKFNAAKFTENVKRLAANPAFQQCVKAHPDTAFSAWKQLQVREKAPEQLLKDAQQPAVNIYS